MEEAPENGKESPHSVHANGLIDYRKTLSYKWVNTVNVVVVMCKN